MHGVGSTGFVACPWWLIVQRVAEKMVAKPRREQRSSSPLGIALVAASCLFFVVRRGSEFCNGWLKKWFICLWDRCRQGAFQVGAGCASCPFRPLTKRNCRTGKMLYPLVLTNIAML